MKNFLQITLLTLISFSFSSSVSAETIRFPRSLGVGMRGDDILNLQKYLATDFSVYPEGITSGYYGKLTKKAVASFQTKNGLESTGFVGPKTLRVLNLLTKATVAIPVANVSPPASFSNAPAPASIPTSTITPPVNKNTTPHEDAVISPVTTTNNLTTITGTKRVIINYKKIPTKTDEDSIRKKGGKTRHAFKIIPAIAAEVSDAEITNLYKDPNVASVEIDALVHARIDQEYRNTWGVLHIGSDTAFTSGQTGKTVKVAVLDTGIDYNNTDLISNYAGGYNFVTGTTDPMDDNGHGTHVAGTIGAVKNNIGVVGVAPDVIIYALKVLDAQGNGYTSDVISALQWSMNNGIHVVNNSYGTTVNPGTALESTFAILEAKGIVSVASAGNSGTCAGNTATIEYPAMYSSVIAVAATDSLNTRPCFSATGSQIELSAPGVNINSTKLGGGNIVYSGTSMASPHVAGVVVLLLAMNVPDANGNGRNNDEIRNILHRSALDIGTAGRDNWYGYGLVKADTAIAMASQLLPTTPTPITTTPDPVADPVITPIASPITPKPKFNPSPTPLPITLPVTSPYEKETGPRGNSETHRHDEDNRGSQVKEIKESNSNHSSKNNKSGR